jgi:hypothetical protein
MQRTELDDENNRNNRIMLTDEEVEQEAKW